MDTPLNDYLRREQISDADFGALIGRDRTMVSKLRRGIVRPTLDVADRIERATAGAVPMRAWLDVASMDAAQPEEAA